MLLPGVAFLFLQQYSSLALAAVHEAASTALSSIGRSFCCWRAHTGQARATLQLLTFVEIEALRTQETTIDSDSIYHPPSSMGRA